MLAKKYAPNRANWVQKCNISTTQGVLPPCNPRQSASVERLWKIQTTEDMLSESPRCNDMVADWHFPPFFGTHIQMWNSTAFSEKRSESRSQRLQKHQYFEWGSTLNLDGFKIIIFQYICEPLRYWKEGLTPGGTDLERGYGDVRPWRPPFHSSPVVRKGPISSKRVSSQDPLLRKFGNFSLYSLNFCPNFSSQAPNLEIFSSQAPKFGLTSPQIRKFSVHKPPLSEASISSQAPHSGPHTSEIRAAHTYLKKSWVPTPPPFDKTRCKPMRNLAKIQMSPKHVLPPGKIHNCHVERRPSVQWLCK